MQLSVKSARGGPNGRLLRRKWLGCRGARPLCGRWETVWVGRHGSAGVNWRPTYFRA